MERKNMVLLTVIAVATLLVAVVGATFAYFTATATTNNSTEANVTTTKDLGGATVTFTGTEKKLELLDYPGGLAVYGAKATIKKTDPRDANDYQATFGLKISYINQTSTDLEWDLYMVAQEYDGLDADNATTCKLQQKQVGSEVQFWYADQSDPEDDTTQTCNGEGIATALDGLGATKIASGKLKMKQNDSKEITQDNLVEEADGTQHDGVLSKRMINTKSASDKYYYLVVKYPNSDAPQADDEGKQISVTLSIDGDIQSTLYSAS